MQPISATYTCKIYTQSGAMHDVTNAVVSLKLSDGSNELAQKASVEIVNILVNGVWFLNQVNLGDQLLVFASDSENSNQEIFRGTIWDWDYKSSKDKLLKLTAYDHLIYTQKSKDNRFYKAGKSTKSIVADVASDWGIPISYNYSSITHEKVLIKNKTISDIFIDLLDEAKKKSGGEKYIIRSTKGTMYIMRRGSNSRIYQFHAKENAISTTHKKSLDGVVTRVLITGKEGTDTHAPVEATINGNTNLGVLQEIITRDADTTLGDAKKEASGILAEKGAPKESFGLSAPDVPWLRKGDAIYLQAGNLIGTFFITSITHDCVKKTMDADLEYTDESYSYDGSGAWKADEVVASGSSGTTSAASQVRVEYLDAEALSDEEIENIVMEVFE